MRPTILATALLSLAITQHAAAQVPPASERVEVRVINVDAHVTDRNGAPFLGLAADDFEILEDGRPQPVTNFAIVEKTRVRPSPNGEARLTDARYHRRVAIVIDNNNLEKRDRDQALEILAQFADESIGPDAEWSVGFIGEQFELIQPFTTDKELLKAAVTKVRNTPVRSSFGEQKRDILSDGMRRNNTLKGIDYEGTVAFVNREQNSRAARSAVNTARGIVQATQVYGQSSGKKVLFLITGGIQLNTTFTAYEKKNFDREIDDAKKEVQKLLEGLVQEANSANVSIDVIAARTTGSMGPQFDVENSSAGFNRPARKGGGAIGGSGMSQAVSNDPIDTSDVDSANFKMAVGTGGMYLTSNRVRDSFDRAEENSSHYYSLGYRPSHAEDGQYHRITVRLKKPGYQIAHRQGYSDIAAEPQLEALLKMRVSALQPAVAVPVTLDVELPPAATEGKPSLVLTASMPMKNVTLLDQDGKSAGKAHVYLAVFDANGKNVAFQHMTQDVVVPVADRDAALAGDFRYKMRLKLDRGEYTLALTLRDELSREIGTAVRKVSF